MKRAGLEFEEINIEHDEAAAKYVEEVNGGNQTVPVVRFDDGTAMTNPSIKEVTDHVANTTN
jgi:mycoredoxin